MAHAAQRPHDARRPRARPHADHGVGDELLLPRGPRGPDQSGHGLEPRVRLPRFHRGAARHGPRLECRGSRDRPPRRAGRDDARHRPGVPRPLRAVAGAQRSGLPGRLGVPGRRHAALPVRCRVRRPGAGRAVARAEGDLLSDAVRGVRLVGVLAARSCAERTAGLAADPRRVRTDQSGGLLAAALVRARAP